jgi:hypothetical protein
MQIETRDDFVKALEHGPYAWPGGYPVYFVMADGEAMSFDAVKAERSRIEAEFLDASDKAWQPVALEVNWEDSELYCAHTNARIESAYAD